MREMPNPARRAQLTALVAENTVREKDRQTAKKMKKKRGR